MERDPNDVNHDLSTTELSEMEDRRIERLKDAGIDEQAVLEEGGKNLNTWNSYFNENIVRGKDDVNFTIRDQWSAVERSEFTRLSRASMTSNILYDPIKKLVGEQRKNKPDLIVRSLTGKASQEEINLRADLVRNIAYASQTDLVYQVAAKSALMMGFGSFQISLEYESPRSFRQVPRYHIIPDTTRCSWDPTALKPHKGDGNFCSRSFVFTRDEFFATYPYVLNPVSYIDPYMLLDFQWQTRDTIVVQDYYNKEWYPLIIYKLSDGTTCSREEWKEREKNFENNKEFVKGSIIGNIIIREIPKIIEERQTQDYNIMHYRMIRDRIIDFSEWPSRQLPIVFVDGDSYFIEGRQYTKSFIHEARDMQKLRNYGLSELATEIKNRRREQWLATPDNIIGYEQQWRNPETQAGALMARPDPKTGLMPQKMPAWEISQGIFATAQSATQAIHEILGFSEAQELQGRDISGKARRERKIEGSMSAYVFQDNLNQAIEQGGRIVNDLLPYVAGEDEREIVITKKDGRTENITLNQRNKEGEIINRIIKGDFDVEIDTGPSFAVQKEVALEFLQQTVQTFPQSFPLIADLWAKNLDVQFMPQMAERFKSLVPPQLLAKEEGKELPPQPPSPQEQMMQQEMKLRQQQLIERAQELKIRQEKHKLEEAEVILKAKQLASQMGINEKKMQVDMDKADMDFITKISKVLVDAHA